MTHTECVVRHPCERPDRVAVDPVGPALERCVGAVAEDGLEDRLEDEAREDDQEQAGERGKGKPLPPESPPDERAVPDRGVERRAASVVGRRRVSRAVRHGPILIPRAEQPYRGPVTRPGQLHIQPDLLPDLRGRHVLLLDDILDTGQTLASLWFAAG